MLNSVFTGIFDTNTTGTIAVSDFLLCVSVSLVLGILLALAYTYKTRYTRSFVVTLAMIPAIVCVVIMMVNGNIGVGVAVAGAFSLVRFRSVPGTAKEIGAIFLAMGVGLMTGMGYLAYGAMFAVILGAVWVGLTELNFGAKKSDELERTLRITIPEDLDYTQVFDDLFETYTTKCENVAVKTTNMGSMYKLTYEVTLKDKAKEKEFMDELRCRNANLEVSMCKPAAGMAEL